MENGVEHTFSPHNFDGQHSTNDLRTASFKKKADLAVDFEGQEYKIDATDEDDQGRDHRLYRGL